MLSQATAFLFCFKSEPLVPPASSPALPDRAIDSNYLGEYKKLEEIILERTRTDVGTIQRSWQYLRSQVEIWSSHVQQVQIENLVWSYTAHLPGSRS